MDDSTFYTVSLVVTLAAGVVIGALARQSHIRQLEQIANGWKAAAHEMANRHGLALGVIEGLRAALVEVGVTSCELTITPVVGAAKWTVNALRIEDIDDAVLPEVAAMPESIEVGE